MTRRTANAFVIIIVLLGILLFLADRYVFTPRSVQSSIFGEPVTSLGEIPSFNRSRGMGPWVESWTYSPGDSIPAHLQTRYGCGLSRGRITCSRCQSKLLGMCFLKEVELPSGEYRNARIIGGKLQIDRGVGEEEGPEPLPALEVCLRGDADLPAFEREMRSLAQVENMRFTDRSSEAKKNFDAIDPKGRSHDPTRAVLEIAIDRRDGMGLVASNLALQRDRMVISFSQGASRTEAQSFASRVTTRLARQWSVVAEGPDDGMRPEKACPSTQENRDASGT